MTIFVQNDWKFQKKKKQKSKTRSGQNNELFSIEEEESIRSSVNEKGQKKFFLFLLRIPPVYIYRESESSNRESLELQKRPRRGRRSPRGGNLSAAKRGKEGSVWDERKRPSSQRLNSNNNRNGSNLLYGCPRHSACEKCESESLLLVSELALFTCYRAVGGGQVALWIEWRKWLEQTNKYSISLSEEVHAGHIVI